LLFNGNPAAFEEIFNRYWLKLYAAAYKRVKCREVSEEIIQDLFTILWTKRGSVQIHTSLAAYLYTSVRYLVFNHLQKEMVRENYKDSFLAANKSFDNSTEEAVLVNDLNRNIEKVMNYLPPKCRSVFELSRKENKTNREIAEVLGISEKTVEGHLTKAIKQLKSGLTDISRLASWFF
jgi:RNA polymerase sigma-70 factor (ECF subfamily)